MSFSLVERTLADSIETLVQLLVMTQARDELPALCLSICKDNSQLATFRGTLRSSLLSVFLSSDGIVRAGRGAVLFSNTPAWRLLRGMDLFVEFGWTGQIVNVIVVC